MSTSADFQLAAHISHRCCCCSTQAPHGRRATGAYAKWIEHAHEREMIHARLVGNCDTTATATTTSATDVTARQRRESYEFICADWNRRLASRWESSKIAHTLDGPSVLTGWRQNRRHTHTHVRRRWPADSHWRERSLCWTVFPPLDGQDDRCGCRRPRGKLLYVRRMDCYREKLDSTQVLVFWMAWKLRMA